MILQEIERNDVEWIDLPLDKETWLALGNTAMNLWVT
jgi:hypothetical protein